METKTEVKAHEEKAETQYNLIRLIKHMFNVICFKTGNRLSRGEYFLANYSVNLISKIVMLVIAILISLFFKSVGEDNISYLVIAILVSIIVIGMNVNFTIKRLQDLGENGRKILWIILPNVLLLGFIAVWAYLNYDSFISILSSQDPQSYVDHLSSAVWLWLIPIIGLYDFAWVVRLTFTSGEKGENKYGPDTLATQPENDQVYMRFFILIVIIEVIINMISSII